MRGNIQTIKHRRQQYLQYLYEITQGQRSKIVDMWDLGKELHLSRDETLGIVEYLSGEHMLEYVTIGGGISIAHFGIVSVESSYEESASVSTPGSQQGTTVQTPNIENDIPTAVSAVKILFLAANPRDTDRLGLAEEIPHSKLSCCPTQRPGSLSRPRSVADHSVL